MTARAQQVVDEAHSLGQKYLLASIVESSEDAIISKTLEGIITSWNPAAARMYGYSSEEILGRPITTLIRSDRPDEMPEILKKVRAGESIKHYETLRIRKDGSEVAVSLTVSAVLDASGAIVGASSISRDISERLRAEEQQRTATQYARSLIEASLDPLVTISPEGKITDVNEATITVTGIDRGSLIGMDFSDYFTEPDKARKVYQQVFAEGLVADYPLTIRHREGRLYHVLYNGSTYKDSKGSVLGVFAATRDVTAQHLAEAEIMNEREKQLERLAELERFQKLTVGRELKMIELKKEVAELRRLIEER